MHKRTITITLLTGATTVAAQATAPLTLELTQHLVQHITKDGKTTEKLLGMPPTVRPGDVLVQEVAAHNTTSKALTGAAIQLPVPQGTIFLGTVTSEGDAKINYSYDGGKTFGEAPLQKTITVTENGKSITKQVTVQPSEYTNVRWTAPSIKANSTLKLSFRVKVK